MNKDEINPGNPYRKLVPVSYDDKKGWYCKCECGNYTFASSYDLIKGRRKSCGCEWGRQLSLKDGDRFGKLVVRFYDKKKKAWYCDCDCGGHTYATTVNLKNKKHRGCSCYQKQPRHYLRRPGNETLKLMIFRNYKKSSKKRDIKFDLPKKFFFEMIQSHCHYCGENPMNTQAGFLKYDKDFRYNGVDRVDNNKGYYKENVVPCCYICNAAKSDMTLQKFKEWSIKLYNKMNATPIVPKNE